MRLDCLNAVVKALNEVAFILLYLIVLCFIYLDKLFNTGQCFIKPFASAFYSIFACLFLNDVRVNV